MVDKKQKNYRDLHDELERAIAQLQSGEGDIDELVVAYGRAMELIEDLQSQLESKENAVKKITRNWGKKTKAE